MTSAVLLQTAPGADADLNDAPIQSAVRRALAAAGFAYELSIAERSPFGRRALRLRPAGAMDLLALADILKQAAWAEAVAVVPPNVYATVRLEALRDWLTRPNPAPQPGAGAGLRAVLTFPDPETLDPAPLEALREAAVALAIAAMLDHQGYRVECRAGATAAGGAFRRNGEIIVRIADRTGGSLHDGAVAVAGVDLPQGPLRARYGGTLTVGDLLADLRRPAGPAAARGHQAAMPLAQFLMLRCPRTRRLTLDDGKIAADGAVYAALLQALDARGAGGGDDAHAVADLVLAMDMTGCIAQRAIEAFEPYFFARHLRALAFGAATQLSADDPLRTPVSAIVRTGLDWLTPRPGAWPSPTI